MTSLGTEGVVYLPLDLIYQYPSVYSVEVLNSFLNTCNAPPFSGILCPPAEVTSTTRKWPEFDCSSQLKPERRSGVVKRVEWCRYCSCKKLK